MKTPLLETERLILRPVTLEDAPAIQHYFNDWNIIRHLSLAVPWPYPEDGALCFIRDNVLPRVKNKGDKVWSITVKSHGTEAFGVIDFHMEPPGSQGNRGFWIAEEFQGRGYMTEAIAAVNDYLFFEEGTDKFIVVNAKTNTRSRRVKEKTGSVYIGKGHLAHHSGETETELWEVTRENWIRFREAQPDHSYE